MLDLQKPRPVVKVSHNPHIWLGDLKWSHDPQFKEPWMTYRQHCSAWLTITTKGKDCGTEERKLPEVVTIPRDSGGSGVWDGNSLKTRRKDFCSLLQPHID